MADVVAETTAGRLRGQRHGGHLSFHGVPYAGSVSGPGRFRPPPPVVPWSGVRDALVPGPVAPQDPLVPPPYRAVAEESEDCLSLNVFTPDLDGHRRPVLLWIHGGGFSHGAGSQPTYDGGPLVRRGDVVVVTINYRVGALGYLTLAGHGGDAWGATANAGQLDQVAALHWVHDNIALFGGDPDNVTIFGQSAGAVAVATLLAMPAAQGLFAKAIAQSGTANHLGDLDSAVATAGRYLDRLGIADASVERLRAVSVPDLLAAQGPRGALGPCVDGDTLPRPPLATVATGAAAPIPLLVGTVRDEQKLYVARDRPPIDEDGLRAHVGAMLPRRAKDRVDDVIDVQRASLRDHQRPAGDHDVLDALATASRFRMPALRLAATQRIHQPKTFVYQFDWESPARGGSLGACHGIEVPFVFGAIGRLGDDRLTGGGPDAVALSGQMMDAWIAFARSGDPSHPGVGPWPAYDSENRDTMVFGSTSGLQSQPYEEERAMWESMISAPAPVR